MIFIGATCSAPGALADADIISPANMAADATFNQGDKVVYKCKTGSEILTRVCTSEGQWTQGGYVCGGNKNL